MWRSRTLVPPHSLRLWFQVTFHAPIFWGDKAAYVCVDNSNMKSTVIVH